MLVDRDRSLSSPPRYAVVFVCGQARDIEHQSILLAQSGRLFGSTQCAS